MHLLIISSASSTPKAIRSVSGTGALPLQRDLLGIFVYDRCTIGICICVIYTYMVHRIYDGAERSWEHGKKSGIAEV